MTADLDALRAELAADAAAVAERLLGPPNRALSSRGELRWGCKGSFRLRLTGTKRGTWSDFEAGEGGDLLGLIRRERGGDFGAAVEWARAWTGLGADRAEPAKARPRPTPARRNPAKEAEAEAERALARARRIIAGGVPIAGTAGERYLKQVRGIPMPADGWPSAIQWHPHRRALLAIATTADGEARAVQCIYLTEGGERISPQELESRGLRASKTSFGPQVGTAVRLPGKLPVLLAEGAETGLAGYAPTGNAMLIALGSLAKLTPPPFAVALADDDRRHSPADRALRRALKAWQAQGCDVVVARPWPVRRHDKSDFADLILQDGPDAVRARIALALDAGTSAVRRVPVEVARVRLRQVMDAFAVRAAGSVEPFAQAVKVSTGAGKSEMARRQAVNLVRTLRAKGDIRTVVIALPRHDLEKKYLADLREIAPELTAAAWRGREAVDPAAPGAAMCQDLALVQAAQAAYLDPDANACGPCAFAAQCAYQRQRRQRADIWLIPSASLSHAPPAALGRIAALFVDEDPLSAFLSGTARLAVDALDRPVSIEGDPVAADRLRDLRRQAVAVLRQAEDGPALRSAFLEAGLTRAAAKEAGALEWRTKTEADTFPGMPRGRRLEAVQALRGNRDLGRRAMWWNVLAALLADDGPERSGWARLTADDGEAGPVRTLELSQRRSLPKGWTVPTFIMDAGLQADQLRYVWPDLEVTADIAVTQPHMRIRQVIDRAYSLAMLDAGGAREPTEAKRRTNRLRELHAVIAKEARQYAPGQVLVVAQKAVRVSLEAMGNLPPTVAWAHHGAVTSRDEWKNARAMILVGRTQPPPAAVEALAETLTGNAVERLPGWYQRTDAVREMEDGSLQAAEADRHPDPVAESFRRQVCEQQLMQVLGRPRGVNRTQATPVDVLALTDVPLDLPVAETIAAADLAPGPGDRQLAAGGVAYVDPAAAARAYPGLWRTGGSARSSRNHWIEQHDSRRTLLKEDCFLSSVRLLARARFRRAGSSNHHNEALIDLSVVADPRAAIEGTQGELAEFELIEPPAIEAAPSQDAADPPNEADTSTLFEPERNGWPVTAPPLARQPRPAAPVLVPQ